MMIYLLTLKLSVILVSVAYVDKEGTFLLMKGLKSPLRTNNT